MRDFSGQKGAETRKLRQEKNKRDLLLQGYSLLGMAAVYQADYLTNADQVVPD